MKTRFSSLLCIACVGFLSTTATRVLADVKPVSKEDAAETSFREGMAHASRGDYAAACPAFEKSQKLDPGLGTQFNLADCYEHTGRLVEAYRLFSDVGTVAHLAGKSEREGQAKLRMAELAKRLGLLSIGTVKVENLPGFRVNIDGRPLGGEELAAPVALTPGRHEVRVSANAKESWTATTDLKAGQRVALEVPVLADTVANPKVGGSTASPSTKRAETADTPRATSTTSRSWQLPLGLAVGGAGVVGLGVGGVFGLLSLAKHNEASEVCPSPSPCPDVGAAQGWTDATRHGTISSVGFVAGGVLAAGGAALVLTAPTESSPVAQHVSVHIGVGQVMLGGMW